MSCARKDLIKKWEEFNGEKCKLDTYLARSINKHMIFEEAIKPTSKLTEQIRAINPTISLSTVKNRLFRGWSLEKACTEPILPPSGKGIRKYKEYDKKKSKVEYKVYVRRRIDGRDHERALSQPKKVLGN